jgi:uncharacterized protein (TIRG00374 family)
VCRLAVAAALLIFVLSRGGNMAAVEQLLAAAWLAPLLAGQTLTGAAIESMRLGVLFRSQGVRVPFAYGFRLVAVAAFFSLCIPGGTGGDVMKLYYLASKHRGRGVEVATVLLVDRALAMFVLLGVVVGLALVEGRLIREHPAILILVIGAAAMMAVLVVLAAASCSRRIRAARWHVFLMRRPRLGGYLSRTSDALLAFRHHRAAVLQAATLSLAGHLLLAGMFAAAGRVVLPQAPAAAVCVLSLLGMFANALPVTPGGLGVGESAFQGLFGMAGFAGGAALMLAWRVAMLALCALGSFFYVAGHPEAAGRAAVLDTSAL